MSRTSVQRLACLMAMAGAASVASADPLDWGWVDVASVPPRGPVGSGTNGPENITDAAAPVNPVPGQRFYYMIDNGQNSDNNGGGTSHFEVEGSALGSFRGTSWLEWQGLVNGLAADADAAFGAGNWTISNAWISLDEASFSFGNTGGCVAISEVFSSGDLSVLADLGDPAQGCQQTGSNDGAGTIAADLPVGHQGFMMTPTAGAPTNQVFHVVRNGAVPAGSVALTSNGGRVVPADDFFIVNLAAIDDFAGGQGAGIALSFDGFMSGTFGYSPALVFEIELAGPSGPGACCLPDGTCLDNVEPAACLDQGGTFQGVGVSCATVECPVPTGACCLPDGTCAQMTEQECSDANGGFAPGVACADAICVVVGGGGDDCPCELDGNAAQVDVFDLLSYLDCWFSASTGSPCP